MWPIRFIVRTHITTLVCFHLILCGSSETLSYKICRWNTHRQYYHFHLPSAGNVFWIEFFYMLSWKLNQILIILILCEIVFRSLISTITGKTWKLRTKHIESFQVDAIFNILPYPHNTVWWSIWMWQVLPIRLVHASSRKFLFRKSFIITTYLYRSILVPQSVFLEHFFFKHEAFLQLFYL